MLKKEQYLKTVRRPYSPFFTTLILEGCSEYGQYIDFTGQKYAIRNNIKTDHIWYYAKKELEQGSKIIFKRWINPIQFNKSFSLFQQREKQLMDSTKLDLKSFGKAYKAYMPALILIWRAENPVTDYMRKSLTTKLSPSKVDYFMDKLNIPLRDNFYKREEYDLVATNNLRVHVKEYEWINSRYGEEHPYTIDQAKNRLTEINKKEFLKKWDKEKTKLKKIIQKAKNILGNQNNHIVDLMQFIIFYRTHRTDIMNKAGYLFIPTLKKIASNMGLTYKQLLYCTFQEVSSSKIPTIKIIEQRIKDHAVIMENGNMRCVAGNKSNEIREFFKKESKKITEFKGATAQKGIVIGTSKLVFDRDDYDKMKEGDILVTSMTTPEMLPIMRKATAIITDEGGITCHAAIVSRELNIPCIIGTKIATTVLRDGDLIEVDADRGVVKIIKKAK